MMQKETSFTQKVSILILRNGNQDMNHNVKSGSVNTLKLKSVSWLTVSRSKKQKLLMLLPELKNLARWAEKMAARPAVQKGMSLA